MRCGHRYPGKPFAQDLDSDGGVCSNCYHRRLVPKEQVAKPLCGACGHHFDTDECAKVDCHCTSSLHHHGRFIDQTAIHRFAFSYNYCERAPDRGVVEQTVVTLDGDECGGVPRVPCLTTHLVWSANMKLARERHLQFRADLLFHRKDRYGWILDHETQAPTGTDAFGGVVKTDPKGHGVRCALCGGWMRTVAAKLK
jgi:DNA-directed RNA polymerase subunit RPC12/RpoP